MRPALAHGIDEGGDERVIGVAAHPLVLPADILRIVQVLAAVGADVENDRQRRRRMQPGAGGIERELADRNAHAAGALVAEAEDALAVADDDRLDAVEARIAEDAADVVLVRIAEKQAAGFAENARELLAAQPDRRRIDDRHHLFDVLRQQRVEQCLVGVLQAAQEDVFLDIAAELAEGVEPALDLVIERGDVGRQQPVQLEGIALGLGKGRALVEQRIVEELIAAERSADRLQRLIVHRLRFPADEYIPVRGALP